MNSFLTLEHVGHEFRHAKPCRYRALDNISFSVRKGEIVCLIGNSGCGKSTLIQFVAGFLSPSEGVLIWNGRELDGPGPERTLVFDEDTLLPWLTCFQNVYLGVEHLFGKHDTKGELRARTLKALTRVGMHKFSDNLPRELSAGMRQRVCIARAIATEPQVLLMDDPFNALDPLTRAHLQETVLRIVQGTGTTLLMVTHDVDEAVLMADRVVMLTNGPACTIGKIHPLDLPRPRGGLALRHDPRYLAERANILKFLHDQRIK